MSLICRTFSLATLRNIFPDASSWKASHSGNPHANHGCGTDSNQNASPYVQIYIGNTITTIMYKIMALLLTLLMNLQLLVKNIYTKYFLIVDRVLSPVLEALVPMKTDIQQNVGRIVLKTFCDAWLEHIRNKKIRFRYSNILFNFLIFHVIEDC
jgi:hypothetical protein